MGKRKQAFGRRFRSKASRAAVGYRAADPLSEAVRGQIPGPAGKANACGTFAPPCPPTIPVPTAGDPSSRVQRRTKAAVQLRHGQIFKMSFRIAFHIRRHQRFADVQPQALQSAAQGRCAAAMHADDKYRVGTKHAFRRRWPIKYSEREFERAHGADVQFGGRERDA